MGFRAGKAKGPATNNPSGGGGGNVTGTFTANFIPIATAVHTLGDSVLSIVAGVLNAPVDMTIGAGISIDHNIGQITTIFLHVTSDSAMDGYLHLGGNFQVNTKFTVDAATGNTVVAGTLDAKGKFTQEKSSVEPINTPTPTGTGPWAVAIDLSLANVFFVSPAGAGNTVISNPINGPALGGGFVQKLIIRIEGVGVGGDTMSFDTAYHFTGGAPTIDWSLPGYYYIGFIYNENADQYDCIGPLVGPVFP